MAASPPAPTPIRAAKAPAPKFLARANWNMPVALIRNYYLGRVLSTRNLKRECTSECQLFFAELSPPRRAEPFHFGQFSQEYCHARETF
jgi:hypothetical protein